MANVDTYLKNILSAKYGEEVRGSIHDAIAAINGESASSASRSQSAFNASQEAVVTAREAKNLIGAPLIAATQDAMTDTTKIYVYTGSESGMTYGHWYFYNGTDFVDGGVYNSLAVPVPDTTLSVSGSAADAKTVGDKFISADTEFYTNGANTIIKNGLLAAAGHYESSRLTNNSKINSAGSKVSNSPGFVRTNIINGDAFPADAIEIPDSSYCFQLVGYSSLTYNASVYVSQTPFISGGAGKFLYRKADWPYFAIVITRNPADTTSFTADELSNIASLITRYTYNKIDEKLDEVEEHVDERTLYSIDPSTLEYTYGGLSSKGYSNHYTTRLRLRSSSSSGAFGVLAGSTVTPNAGYKFSIALYSYYASNSDFELIRFLGPRTTAYTIPEDCYIRIAIGTTNDNELWAYDEDGIPYLTEDGELAEENALTLNLIGGTIKSAVESIQAVINNQQSPIHTIDDIPLNAVAYHALWSELMTEQPSIVRTLITNIGNDSTYPVYMYTIRADMDHIAPDYTMVEWDGSNELYAKPKIFISSGVHGNERTTPVALLEFVKSLFNNSEYQRIKNAFDWYILPLCNPWGFSHTAYRNGAITGGSTYDPSTDTAVDNTESAHNGIRQNADGIDFNRRFPPYSGTIPAEVQAVIDALTAATADGRDFAFAMDMHQAAPNSTVSNIVGAFLSLSFDSSSDDKNLIFSKWMQSGSVTSKDFAEYTDREAIQSVFPWDGTNYSTLRNYLSNYAEYATCFEGGQKLKYYGGTDELSNPVARAFISTHMHNFMKALTEIWM